MNRADNMIRLLGDEKTSHYVIRTNLHITLVQKYCSKIAEYDPKRFIGLIQRGILHDISKFVDPERTPYIEISWQYKMKDAGKEYNPPQNIKDMMNQATLHHVSTNSHHPEYYAPLGNQLINRDDRDKPPAQIVDATAMDPLSIGEMVADWCAMAEEKGTNPRDWADKNVNIRWAFSPKQTELIYELIDAVWK